MFKAYRVRSNGSPIGAEGCITFCEVEGLQIEQMF